MCVCVCVCVVRCLSSAQNQFDWGRYLLIVFSLFCTCADTDVTRAKIQPRQTPTKASAVARGLMGVWGKAPCGVQGQSPWWVRLTELKAMRAEFHTNCNLVIYTYTFGYTFLNACLINALSLII